MQLFDRDIYGLLFCMFYCICILNICIIKILKFTQLSLLLSVFLCPQSSFLSLLFWSNIHWDVAPFGHFQAFFDRKFLPKFIPNLKFIDADQTQLLKSQFQVELLFLGYFRFSPGHVTLPFLEVRQLRHVYLQPSRALKAKFHLQLFCQCYGPW